MGLVEIYACDWSVDPKDADLPTTPELPEPGLLPALGDVGSLAIGGAFVHVVRSRHAASGARRAG